MSGSTEPHRCYHLLPGLCLTLVSQVELNPSTPGPSLFPCPVWRRLHNNGISGGSPKQDPLASAPTSPHGWRTSVSRLPVPLLLPESTVAARKGSPTSSSPCWSSSPRASLKEEVSDHMHAFGSNGWIPYPRWQISLCAVVIMVLTLWKWRHKVCLLGPPGH